MSTTHIDAELRRLVMERAEGICEYCLIAEENAFFGCQVDHILSEKHDGPTEAGNLAFACAPCNRAKGSDVGSIHWETGEFIRFFNPRTDRWSEHFKLSGDRIDALTAIGAVTARILGFNESFRRVERQTLQTMKRYPNASARKQL